MTITANDMRALDQVPMNSGHDVTWAGRCADFLNARLSTRASEPASEVVEALKLILVIVEDEAYKVSVNQSRCKHVDALNEVHEVATTALATTPLSPDASGMGASEVERVARYYPDDGGLKKPVRDISECLSVTQVILKHFRPDLFPAALTPVSGHTDGTWEEAIEAAAKVAKAVHYTALYPNDYNRGHNFAVADCERAIRNLSPRAASSEGEAK